MNQWLDISQPVHEKVPVWPGDTPFSYKLNCSKEESGSVNVGQVCMSVHIGTHIDAPFHIDNDGKRVSALELDVFIGKTRVIHLPNKQVIGMDELSKINLEGVTRLLIRTDAWANREIFPETIPYIDESVVPYLSKIGVRLIGIDLPSIDPLNSKDLFAHHQCHTYGIHILEGVVLDEILPGDYELIALPLSIMEADASPTRAVLRKYT